MQLLLTQWKKIAGSPDTMPARSWGELWMRTALTGALFVAAVFAAYEALERLALRDAAPDTLHALHIVRGVGMSVLLATWAFFKIRRARMQLDAERDAHLRTLERRVQERTADLEEARAFTELLFNSLRERILVTDRRGVVVKANRSAEEAAGGPLVGRRCLEVFPSCARAGTCPAKDALEGGCRTATSDVRGDTNGRLWEVEAIAVPASDGPPQLVVEVGRDVTEQKNLEAQLRHGEKMASLGILTAGFAHDLGNPLASLSSELELLEAEDSVERVRESLGVLRRHVARMSRTLREMVDFARRRRDEVSDVSVASAVDDAARLVCHDPRWKRVVLARDLPADLPAVHMVEDHLVLVLVNLMINAADAMPSGGTLTVSARAAGRNVELVVKDTGVGMTSDVLARAATPLFTTKTGARGTGLGLSVCKSIARSVGGDLAIASAPGEGTTVTVRIPIAPGAAADAREGGAVHA